MRSALVLLFAIGCAGAPETPDGGMEPVGDDQPVAETAVIAAAPGMPVVFEPLLVPVPAGTAPRWRLLKSADAFLAAVGTAPENVDFSRSWVVLYDAGPEAVDGTRASIQRITLRGDRLDITTRLSTAEAGCETPPGYAAATALVVLDKTLLEAEVVVHRFLRADDTRRCTALARQTRHLTELTGQFDQMTGLNAWVADLAVDRTATLDLAQRVLLDGDGGDHAFFRAARRVFLAFPVGHAWFGSIDLPSDRWSSWGACARPSGDAAVITHVGPQNPLGLRPGDTIVAVNNEAAPAMFETARRRAVSGLGSASDGHRRTMGAVSLFAGLPVGSRLTVVAPDGARRTVTVPQPKGLLDCTDPLGRDRDFQVKSWIRDDGIAVIRLPGLTLLDPPAGSTFEERRDLLRARILAAFDAVKTAPGLVWDLRANEGGMTPIGFEIIGGMPGARAVTTHTCAYREPFSEPPRFGQGFSLSITPGGPFAYTGKVAVVIDGLALSAADYFAIGLRAATDVPLVGTPAAGAFGGGAGANFTISSDPETEGAGDVYRCVDAAGLPLEGRPAQPTHLVELDPADLAQGIDTQLEAAVRLVR